MSGTAISGSPLDLPNGPRRMIRDQRIRFAGEPAQDWQIGFGSGIAERYADVADKAVSFDSPNR